MSNAIKVRIPKDLDEQIILSRIDWLLGTHRGKSPLLIYKQDGKVIKTGKGKGIEPSDAIKEEFISLVGEENVKM